MPGLPQGSYSPAGRLIFKQMIPPENARVHCGECCEGGVNPPQGRSAGLKAGGGRRVWGS